jgi:mRNA interferase HigB
MNVISYRRIRDFIKKHPDADASLNAWYKTTRKANWQNLTEVQQRYRHADLVGRYVVFNVGHNKYRLIARVVFRSQTVFVISVLTHEEYDRDKWKG